MVKNQIFDMPKTKTKTRGFNLIRKEVTFENRLKGEKQWYTSFNFVVIITITAFGGLALAFTYYNDSTLHNQKVDLVNYANDNVNIQAKSDVEDRLSIINNKFTLYRQVKGQSIDAKKFYEDVVALYPGVKLDRFTYRPGQVIESQVIIPSDAYNELPKFLNALYSKYSDAVVTKVAFQSSSESTLNPAVSATLNINFQNISNLNNISDQ